MTDVHTRAQRSRNMAAIRGKFNKSTELALITLFRANRIKGWRRHSRRIFGTPDFIFPKNKVAIFVDGCFWHGCPKCLIHPKTNKKFWEIKIAANQRRDRDVKKQLIEEGWRVLRFWEHEIKHNSNNIVKKIIF
ncbi:MAG: very short patch repair endonuclease [Smithella sp.]|nr:very short patch repair endonuclease [Smithella sp.]MDD5527614.1 very short patch repair endonuclease [Patescibacteria group bacterium]